MKPSVAARPHVTLHVRDGEWRDRNAAGASRPARRVEPFFSYEVAEAAEPMLVASASFTRVYSA